MVPIPSQPRSKSYTIVDEIKSGDDHAVAYSINALRTSTDSPIDNVLDILTDSKMVFYASLGVNKDIGRLILGVFFRSVTDHVKILIGKISSNVIDMITNGVVIDLSEAIGRLNDMASICFHVNDDKYMGRANLEGNQLDVALGLSHYPYVVPNSGVNYMLKLLKPYVCISCFDGVTIGQGSSVLSGFFYTTGVLLG